MIVGAVVAFGITLFGIFSFYRDIMVDDCQSIELSINMTLAGLFYICFVWTIIFLSWKLKCCRERSLAIIRKWITLSIFDNIDSLRSLAEQIHTSTVPISSTILEYDLVFIGQVRFKKI